MAFGDGAFGRLLGHVGGALINEISTLVKKDRREMISLDFSLSLCHMRTQREVRKRVLTRHQISQHLDRGLPSLQNCEM